MIYHRVLKCVSLNLTWLFYQFSFNLQNIARYKALIMNYIKNEESQLDCLHALEVRILSLYKALIMNYIKNEESQLDCLHALEVRILSHWTVPCPQLLALMCIVHCFQNFSILFWVDTSINQKKISNSHSKPLSAGLFQTLIVVDTYDITIKFFCWCKNHLCQFFNQSEKALNHHSNKY